MKRTKKDFKSSSQVSSSSYQPLLRNHFLVFIIGSRPYYLRSIAEPATAELDKECVKLRAEVEAMKIASMELDKKM